MPKPAPAAKSVETIRHGEATRKNIPTAEYRSVLDQSERDPVRLRYRPLREGLGRWGA